MPAAPSAADPSDQPSFIGLRLWLADSPWRMSGGWLALAGLLAAAGTRLPEHPLLPILLALALTEVLWGALWSQLVPRHAWPLHQAQQRPALPYVQPGSVAARLLGWSEPGPAAAMARAGLPLLAVVALLAGPAGEPALVASGCAVLAVLLGMAAQRAGLADLTCWLQALVQITLPFALGVALAGPWPAAPQGVELAALGLGYTLVGRAFIAGQPVVRHEEQSALAANPGPLLLAIGGAGLVTAVLLVNGQPLAAGVVVLLATAPLLTLSGAYGAGKAARAVQPWLLALTLASGIAVGFGLG